MSRHSYSVGERDVGVREPLQRLVRDARLCGIDILLVPTPAYDPQVETTGALCETTFKTLADGLAALA